MRVVATAGHVDHGKSTLVRALTGTDPDRLAEERRRGLTIELGHGWTDLPSGERLALVDVPGHERFLATMLAGVGAVPAVLLVVAADEGPRPQTLEHLRALDALGVEHLLLAVTKSDLADPRPVAADVRRLLGRPVPWVAVSAWSGQGLDALRRALDDLVAGIPPPPEPWRTRMFVDRSFSVAGAGTVVTGTLAAGSIRVGDALQAGDEVFRVRRLECCHEPVDVVSATARVAVNLRGASPADVPRGSALLTPGSWPMTSAADVAVAGPTARRLVLHVGSASTAVGVRPLGDRHARLTLQHPLPLEPGDRGVLRDPGRHVVVGGFRVLDPYPPALDRRGAAARRAEELARLGPARWRAGVDDPRVAPRDGRARAAAEPEVRIAWGDGPFAVADLDPRTRSLARQAGAITQVGSLAMRPTVADDAVARLAALPQPFSLQDAKAALGLRRRALVPLLEHLDATRRTRRDGDLRRVR